LEADAKAAAAAKAKVEAEAEERRRAEGRKKPGKPAAGAAVGGRRLLANLAAMEEREIDAYIAPGWAKHAAEREAAGSGSPACAKKSRPEATPALIA
jgi:hypothetical protein